MSSIDFALKPAAHNISEYDIELHGIKLQKVGVPVVAPMFVHGGTDRVSSGYALWFQSVSNNKIAVYNPDGTLFGTFSNSDVAAKWVKQKIQAGEYYFKYDSVLKLDTLDPQAYVDAYTKGALVAAARLHLHF